MVKKTRSSFKFYAASVGFRGSCLRQWPLASVLLVFCVTSGHFLVCPLPFLDFHYWLVFKQLQFPKIGLDLGQWEESGLAIKADIHGGAVAQM